MEHVHSGGCGCADEMKGDLDLFSLNDTIAVRSIQCLNEAKPDSGKSCLLCPYEHRSALFVDQQQQNKDDNNNNEDDNKTTTPTYQLLSKQLLTSECDNEVIFNFNFQDEVKIKAFLLTTPINNLTPKTLRVFVNPAVPLDFSTLSGAKPTQQWQCYYDPAGEKTMITRGAAFSRVNHIALHLSGLLRDKTVPNPTSRSPQEVALLNAHGLDGVSHDQFVVGFLGVLGNYTGTHRGVVKDLKYEAVPSADDHPVQQDAFAKKGLGFGL